MKTQNFFAILFLILTVLSACQKEPIPKPLPESGYPSTYEILSQSEWSERNSEFQKINIHEGLILNEYGFVEGEISLNKNDALTKDFIISTVGSLVISYEKYLGIPENTEFNYEEKLRIEAPYMTPFGSDNIKSFFEMYYEYEIQSGWDEELENIEFDFYLNQLNIKERRFLGPAIHFHFKIDDQKLILTNNWYPDAFIPSEEIYTLDDVIPMACRELLKQTGNDFWESKHEFGKVKILISLITESKVEIRECWRINALINETTYGDMLFDTQTGELIKYRERHIYL